LSHPEEWQCEICYEKDIWEQSPHRRKRQLGIREVSEVKRLKELERDNTDNSLNCSGYLEDREIS
jgi:hypothetical protein